jgi:hypothetical protein
MFVKLDVCQDGAIRFDTRAFSFVDHSPLESRLCSTAVCSNSCATTLEHEQLFSHLL